MKAIILVGGYGTRMRPLTFHCPKPIFPFINKTPVQHIVAALSKVGVVEVILGINCQSHQKTQKETFVKDQKDGEVVPINAQAAQIIDGLQGLAKKYNIKVTYSQKHQALGTAGPIKFAEEELKRDNKDGLFFVFNSDIIANYPLEELLAFHKSHGKEASIVLAEVKDPSRFGVILHKQNGEVEKFVEKPKQFIGNHINAGIYLLNVSILDRIQQGFSMIETQIYPKLASEKQLYALPLRDNFFFDIGKPADYLLAQGAYLEHHKITSPQTGQAFILIDESSVIEEGCKIGPNVVIGPGCRIGKGTRLSNTTIISNTTVGDYSHINNAIVSWNCTIGNHVRIEGLTVIAEDVEVKNEVRITECMICSHKTVGTNVQKEILL